jgi:O-antigen/teichoic acid export membrane protein
MFVATSVGTGLQPLISQIHKRVRSDVSGSWVVSIGMRTLGAASLVSGTMALLFADDIMLLFGSDYVEYAWILRVFTITMALEFIVILLDNVLIAVGKRREVMTGTVLSLVLALVFELALIPGMAIAGLLVGKILALVCKVFYQQRVVGREYRSDVLRSLTLIVGAGGTVAGAFLLTDGLSLEFRIVALFAAAGLGMTLFRLIDMEGLKILRSMTLSVRNQ